MGIKSVRLSLNRLMYRGDVTSPGSKNDFVKTATRLSYFDGRALRDLALSNDLGGRPSVFKSDNSRCRRTRQCDTVG